MSTFASRWHDSCHAPKATYTNVQSTCRDDARLMTAHVVHMELRAMPQPTNCAGPSATASSCSARIAGVGFRYSRKGQTYDIQDFAAATHAGQALHSA
ncbi:hypothetical protein [Agrilutibacter niabensis]|uniref:hypothetical protein n=1 Tax=Agrilutibacter niabensis TaxID=380628 RepID=UPI00286C4347|nr:hypothetical protein [Lysobacter niabensis]